MTGKQGLRYNLKDYSMYCTICKIQFAPKSIMANLKHLHSKAHKKKLSDLNPILDNFIEM